MVTIEEVPRSVEKSVLCHPYLFRTWSIAHHMPGAERSRRTTSSSSRARTRQSWAHRTICGMWTALWFRIGLWSCLCLHDHGFSDHPNVLSSCIFSYRKLFHHTVLLAWSYCIFQCQHDKQENTKKENERRNKCSLQNYVYHASSIACWNCAWSICMSNIESKYSYDTIAISDTLPKSNISIRL